MNTGEKNRKKIIYVITKSNFGGAQRYVYDLATRLPKKDFDVAVAAGGDGLLAKKLTEDDVRFIQVASMSRDIGLWKEVHSFFALTSLFRKEKPDIVHLNSSKAGLLGSLAARAVNMTSFRKPRHTIKIIFTGHGWAFNEERGIFSQSAIMFLHWLTIRLTDLTIAVSEKTAGDVKRLPFISKKIHVIHNGVEKLRGFYLKKEARRLLNSEAHKTLETEEALWIGTISELHKNKGLDFAIEAFGRIAKHEPLAHFIIIGEGEERANLEKIIAEKKLTDKVTLVGRIDTAWKYLKAFDIFTLTSRTEALPYVILEAGTAEVPIVASAVGGIPEIIHDRESGLLVRPRDPKEISDALLFLLENKKKAREFAKNLHKKISTEFSADTMTDSTIKLYNTVT